MKKVILLTLLSVLGLSFSAFANKSYVYRKCLIQSEDGSSVNVGIFELRNGNKIIKFLKPTSWDKKVTEYYISIESTYNMDNTTPYSNVQAHATYQRETGPVLKMTYIPRKWRTERGFAIKCQFKLALVI